jgi:hypothetical protein
MRKVYPQIDTAEPRRLHVRGAWDLGVLANEIRSHVASDFQGWEANKQIFDIQVDRVTKALRADEGAREKPPPSRL